MPTTILHNIMHKDHQQASAALVHWVCTLYYRALVYTDAETHSLFDTNHEPISEDVVAI